MSVEDHGHADPALSRGARRGGRSQGAIDPLLLLEENSQTGIMVALDGIAGPSAGRDQPARDQQAALKRLESTSRVDGKRKAIDDRRAQRKRHHKGKHLAVCGAIDPMRPIDPNEFGVICFTFVKAGALGLLPWRTIEKFNLARIDPHPGMYGEVYTLQDGSEYVVDSESTLTCINVVSKNGGLPLTLIFAWAIPRHHECQQHHLGTESVKLLKQARLREAARLEAEALEAERTEAERVEAARAEAATAEAATAEAAFETASAQAGWEAIHSSNASEAPGATMPYSHNTFSGEHTLYDAPMAPLSTGGGQQDPTPIGANADDIAIVDPNGITVPDFDPNLAADIDPQHNWNDFETW